MHYLICDVNIKKQGHYIGYNQYILDNIHTLENQESDRTYSFLYNKEAEYLLTFPEYVKNKVLFINENGWNSRSILSKISLFKKISSFAEGHKIDHLIFVDLDQYQLPIFIAKGNFEISGILFRPHHRIISSGKNISSKFFKTILRIKKIIAEKLLLLRENVKNIYILNDQEGVVLLNKIHNSQKFKYLPDPIFTYSSPSIRSKKSNAYTFLIFGAINERKNIPAILLAYDATQFNRETELLIVGSAKEEYLNYLHQVISNLKTIQKEKFITIRTGFVSNEEMDEYFSQSDVCLLIYKDFYGSSGLLGRAALHQKKVIGTNVGLLKELIEQNNLGTTCSPDSIEEISKSLDRITTIKVEASSFEEFYKKYSPDTFISTLLTSNS